MDSTQMDTAQLDTAREVVAALGGIVAVARLTGRKPGAVSAWQARHGSFPAVTFAIMTDELTRIGKSAPRCLWRMKEAA